MRLALLAVLAAQAALAACSVPEKTPLVTDGGADGPPTDSPPDDNTAPETTITAAPPEFAAAGSSTFEFSSDDPAAHFECSIDGDTPVACNSPYTRTLGDGAHTFSVRAIDAIGNSDDTPAEHLWTIDTVAPSTMLTDTPPSADNSVMVQFAFESNEMNVIFECSLDNASFVQCTTGQQFGPLSDGAHSFAVRAKDRAGNVDASPSIFAWNVDTSTPDTQILSGPSGPTDSSSATFTFVSPDAGAGATYTCSLDGGAYSACTSPKTVSGLTMGNHVFAVRVRDAVGNMDPTPATREWSVDLTAPNTTILTGPSGTVRVASASFTFTATESPVTFSCSLDNAAFTPCTSPTSYANLEQGAHTFAVRATDAANHTDDTPATRSWTIDTVAPEIVITAGPAEGSTSGPRVSFGFTVSDGTVQCSFDDAAFTACTSPAATNLPAGAHQFRIRATDAAGNVSTETRSWTVACAAPSTLGAAGLLHLDDPGQTQTNAVTGGVPAVLGDDATVEPADPSILAAGRFGGALSFTASESDRVTWPAAIGPSMTMTIELWARPDAPAGTRDIFVTGDDRVSIQVMAASPSTVRFSATIVESDGQARTATSSVVAAGKWHHVLLTVSQPMVQLWVDGADGSASGLVLGTAPSFDAIRLGGTGAAAYSGDLDEVYVALTALGNDEAVLQRYCPVN
ncbi:MAG TPA: LamG domain-containing protein [Kofleriaceae bacterium]|nr:LamG domain-containing protein [Kofleriaceae bacterium]